MAIRKPRRGDQLNFAGDSYEIITVLDDGYVIATPKSRTGTKLMPEFVREVKLVGEDADGRATWALPPMEP